MNVRPSLMCPVDCSGPSASALRYAAAVAEHFATRLIVLGVTDPVPGAAPDVRSGRRRREQAAPKLAAFVEAALADDPDALIMCEQDSAPGNPAAEILRVARERSCDLIVMSAHGAAERRTALGSTAACVLRGTRVPVLVTPPENPGRIRVEDASRLVRRIIAPVDLTPASTYQAEVAAQLAEAIALPLVFVHVLEPVSPSWATRPGPNVLVEDRQTSIAQTRITTLLTTMPRELDVASLMLRGDPAEEVARVVRDSHAGLVVMGLHDRTACGPRLGSVAFRTLSLAPVLVLGLPPRLSSAVRADDSPARLHVTELLEAASR